MSRQPIDQGVNFLPVANAIHMQAGDRQIASLLQVFAQSPKIGGQQQFGAATFQLMVGGLEGQFPVGVQFGDQNRLIHLNPVHVQVSELFQQLAIHRKKALQ